MMRVALATLLAFAASAAHAQSAPAATASNAQVVAIGQAMKAWKGGVTKEHGRLMCRTKESSGDRQVDAIRCGALLTCTKAVEPQIDALMASAASPAQKSDGYNALLAGAKPCTEKYEAAAVARLAAERTRL